MGALLDALAAFAPDQEDALVTAIVSLGKEPPARDERVVRFFGRICDAVAVNAKTKSTDDESKYVVKALNGFWLDSEGLVCRVEGGKCATGDSSKVSIAVKKDQIVMNGWVASAISSKTVEWQKGEKSMTWNRISQTESERREAERQAALEAERVAKVEAERKKKEEIAEKKRAQEAEKKAKAEAERKAKEEAAEKKRQEEEEKKAKKEAE